MPGEQRLMASEHRSCHELTGLSKTDIVNRAITLYEFVDAVAVGWSLQES